MNSWNFNELTQQDALDYKACKRQDGSIYGVPEKSDCVTGKEITKEDIQKLAEKSNKGDKKASAILDEVSKVNREQSTKAKKEKAEAEKKKKKAEAEKNDKKKGGKGKKGGGKKGGGKKGGGKGKAAAKGGGGSSKPAAKKDNTAARKAQQEAQQNRKSRQQEMRKHLSDLQGALRKVKDPAARKVLEDSITELMKGVAELSKTDGQAPEQGKAPAGGAIPPAPKAEKKEKA